MKRSMIVKFWGTGHLARPRQVSSSIRCSSNVSRSAPSSLVGPVLTAYE